MQQSLGYLIRSTHQHFQSLLAARIEPHGITLGMWYFLRVLWEEDGLSQRELSNRVGTMEPTTFEAIRAMEAKGLVRRERDPEDARKRLVFLSTEGKSLEARLLPLAQALVSEAAADLSETEQDALRGLLQKLRGRLIATRNPTTS